MGKPETATGMSLMVSDVTGQKTFVVGNAPTDSTVGEVTQDLLGKMNLPQSDSSGRPLNYHARLEMWTTSASPPNASGMHCRKGIT